MCCPFLREARAGQCSGSTLRKAVLRVPAALSGEKCSSSAYTLCATYGQHPPGAPPASQCPYLDEWPMQYCSAAPVPKYVRNNDATLGRCGTDRHLYCDLYLAVAGSASEGRQAAGMRFPAHLAYAANHLWFDAGAGDTWHVGIDAFMAEALGTIGAVRFLTDGRSCLPSTVLSSRGIDVQVTFPFPLRVTAVHDHLRARPELLRTDPYGKGWLFEGDFCGEPGALVRGPGAVQWLERDVARLLAYIDRCLARERITVDRGAPGFGQWLAYLSRDELAEAFQEFFSLEAGVTTQS